MKNAHWTTQERQYIVDNWGKLPVSVIARNLDRTVNGIKGQRSRLGLPSLIKTGGWGEEESRFLISSWPEHTIEHMAKTLGRTEAEVKEKAWLLDLKKREKLRPDSGETSAERKQKPAPHQHRYDIKPGDKIIAPYLSKTVEYENQDKKRKCKPKDCEFTVTAVYPHIFQARLEETKDAGIIIELPKNDYIAGAIRKAKEDKE